MSAAGRVDGSGTYALSSDTASRCLPSTCEDSYGAIAFWVVWRLVEPDEVHPVAPETCLGLLEPGASKAFHAPHGGSAGHGPGLGRNPRK